MAPSDQASVDWQVDAPAGATTAAAAAHARELGAALARYPKRKRGHVTYHYDSDSDDGALSHAEDHYVPSKKVRLYFPRNSPAYAQRAEAEDNQTPKAASEAQGFPIHGPPCRAAQ